jgi:predicted nucleic acid-binding protein
MNPTEAEASLHRLSSSWPVLDVTRDIVLDAARGARKYQLSFGDSLIGATARLNNAREILSEDFSDGQQIEGVSFSSPFSTSFQIARLS